MVNRNGATLLVVDDTPTNVTVLLGHLSRAGYKVLVAADGASAIDQARYARPDLILLDVMMPGLDGYKTCERLKDDPQTADIPIIFTTALGDLDDKIRAFAAGGVDHVAKPFQAEEVLARVNTHLELRRLHRELAASNADLERRVADRTLALEQALQEVQQLKARLEVENAYLQAEVAAQPEASEIVGRSPPLKTMLQALHAVADSDATVLVHGETGTGKELIARALHQHSRRRGHALVKLNCAAISAGLVESELFGHVKGAFTGATDRRVGRFELADGGTLFLDEISELPPETQTKLLRVLQEREFEPVGSSKTVRVDVRIVAATNRDLAVDVARGRFRADLYYRLNVFPLRVPALRERREDIPLLAEHFLARFARRLGRAYRGIAAESLARLVAHDWPGNVRDLQNVIERAAVLSRGSELVVDWDLGPGIAGGAANGGAPAAAFATTSVSTPTSAAATSATAAQPISATGAGGLDALTLSAIERRHIVDVLRRTRGVIEGPHGAAALLDLKPSTARFRIRKLGIRRSEYASD